MTAKMDLYGRFLLRLLGDSFSLDSSLSLDVLLVDRFFRDDTVVVGNSKSTGLGRTTTEG